MAYGGGGAVVKTPFHVMGKVPIGGYSRKDQFFLQTFCEPYSNFPKMFLVFPKIRPLMWSMLLSSFFVLIFRDYGVVFLVFFSCFIKGDPGPSCSRAIRIRGKSSARASWTILFASDIDGHLSVRK